MIVFCQARGCGKTLTAMQRMREAIENGETILCVRKTGSFLIDKNGPRPVTPPPKAPENLDLQRRISCLDFEIKPEDAQRRERMWDNVQTRKLK